MDPALLKTVAQYGLVGLILLDVLWWKKLLVPRWVYDHCVASAAQREADLKADVVELKAGLREYTDLYTRELLPTLTLILATEQELATLKRAEDEDRRRTRRPNRNS